MPFSERSTMKPLSLLELLVQVRSIWSVPVAAVATRLLGAAGAVALVADATLELADGAKALVASNAMEQKYCVLVTRAGSVSL